MCCRHSLKAECYRCLETALPDRNALVLSVGCPHMVWGCVCVRVYIHWHSSEWTDMRICQRSAYLKFIPTVHTHTHTHVLIPFEDREPTDEAKSGHCQEFVSFELRSVRDISWSRCLGLSLSLGSAAVFRQLTCVKCVRAAFILQVSQLLLPACRSLPSWSLTDFW